MEIRELKRYVSLVTQWLWFVVLVLGRDFLLLIGSLLVRRRRGSVNVVHEVHGKASSVLLFVLLAWITFDFTRAPLPAALFVIAGMVTLSTLGYFRDGWRQWRSV